MLFWIIYFMILTSKLDLHPYPFPLRAFIHETLGLYVKHLLYD